MIVAACATFRYDSSGTMMREASVMNNYVRGFIDPPDLSHQEYKSAASNDLYSRVYRVFHQK